MTMVDGKVTNNLTDTSSQDVLFVTVDPKI